MRGKVLFLGGAAFGYVLGARAGRKRYEQIAAAANKLWESPGLQKQVHQAQDFVAEKLDEVPGAVAEGTRKLVGQAMAKTRGKGSDETYATPLSEPDAE